MAYEVLASFTVNAGSEHEARTILEGLLKDYLDPASTDYQPEPHSVLDSWAVEGLPGWTWTIKIFCETPTCGNHGKAFNTISGIETKAERDAMLEEWKDAHEEADVCPLCKELGHAHEGDR